MAGKVLCVEDVMSNNNVNNNIELNTVLTIVNYLGGDTLMSVYIWNCVVANPWNTLNITF